MTGAVKRHRKGSLRADKITLSHGSGGKAMRDLIEDVFLACFEGEDAQVKEDQARFDLSSFSALGERLAMTTDSFVIHPLFFPGGDIGTLAVNGTVNDLAVGGALPLYLTCSVIIEEGFPLEDLRRIALSIKSAADIAGVRIVTGDTKVVEKGAADKLFINTTGIGVIPAGVHIHASGAKHGDAVIVNGYIGNHGAAIVTARGDLALEHSIESDCQSLSSLVQLMLAQCPHIHCMRDATRGGLGTVLNEFAQQSGVSIMINETQIPIEEEVRGVCEILGLDPLYLANEGTLVAILPAEDANQVVSEMRRHESGRNAAIIGTVCAEPENIVVLQTVLGGQRIVDMLVGDQLPRIC